MCVFKWALTQLTVAPQTLFEQHDADKSGTLEPPELADLVRSVSRKFSVQICDANVKQEVRKMLLHAGKGPDASLTLQEAARRLVCLFNACEDL